MCRLCTLDSPSGGAWCVAAWMMDLRTSMFVLGFCHCSSTLTSRTPLITYIRTFSAFESGLRGEARISASARNTRVWCDVIADAW